MIDVLNPRMEDFARAGGLTALTMTTSVTPDTYRGWRISFDYPPIPCRDFDWSATHPDYDCDCDQDGYFAVSGAIVHASTRDGVISAVDAWIAENSEEAANAADRGRA